jgi:hypothetical protein
MDALTERTLQSLRERLRDFRTKGAIPALMGEYRIGAPDGETQPLRGFEDGLWSSTLRQLPDGTQLCRRLWLAGDRHAAAEFRDTLCLDVGRIVLPILYAAGYRVGLGGDKLQTRWLWAAFELAELRLSGTYLRLDGDTVWRVLADGVEINEGMLTDPGPLAGLAATAGDSRYWKLTNVVEASLAVLDIALLPQEPAAPHPQTAAIARIDGDPGPEPEPRTAEANGDQGKGRPDRKMRPEEQLLFLYLRNPKVATLESRSLPAVAEKEFGYSYTDRAYRGTDLYDEWRIALEENTRHHGRGWLEGDVLEVGLEIYGSKPGRSDKRRTLDAKYEAAVRAFIRDSAAATARAKARIEDGGN